MWVAVLDDVKLADDACCVLVCTSSSSSSGTGLSKEEKKRLKLEQKKKEKMQRMVLSVFDNMKTHCMFTQCLLDVAHSVQLCVLIRRSTLSAAVCAR